MDTTIRRLKLNIPMRVVEFFIPVVLISLLYPGQHIFLPPMFANDYIARSNINVPTLQEMTRTIEKEINPQIARDEFEARIKNKYPNVRVNHVATGVKHIKGVKYFSGRPVKINVVIMNRDVATNLELKPAVASTNTLAHKTTIRTIAYRTKSVVAINGGFFKPQTGVPLGTLMIDGKLYTGPIYDRVAIGIFKDGYDIGRVQLDAKIRGNNQEIRIDNLNQPRILSSLVLAYSSDWGSYAPPSPKYGVQLQIKDNKILRASANPLPIPQGGYVIVGPKSKLEKLFGAQNVNISIKTNPKWENVQHIISGGPYLLKDGEPYIDVVAERLQSIGGKNPRTAIGYTANNDLILVTADGREGSSVGLTLTELAQFMKSLGCTNAINLDGGGSTVMYINGQIVNHPPQPGGIALSNVITIARKN